LIPITPAKFKYIDYLIPFISNLFLNKQFN
jgi:hypothetical protein